jgi:flagellar export protein FliJ
MSSKRARVARVVAPRERRLNEQVKVLADARTEQSRAEAELKHATDEVQSAKQRQRQLGERSGPADDWVVAGDWLRSREAMVARVGLFLAEAKRGVERAHQGVLKARSELKRAELLVDRLVEKERRRLERVEVRAMDELATQRFNSDKNRRERD